jgi:fatty-acyl-CoA synthase
MRNPGVHAEPYTEPARNRGLVVDGFLRTGDLGRLDAEGYLWITGRAKDLIIRGGHNIDPSLIEEAMARHPAVAFAGAVGQPDIRSGELPCVYVELVAGAEAGVEDLLAHARSHISEPAAMPKHLEILDELPKTAVGKVFKPDLRRRAIGRTFDAALAAAGSGARVAQVEEDRSRGLVAVIAPGPAGKADAAATETLRGFVVPWRWQDGD